MKKITDAKLLKEWYDTEADWKMLIGYRFKGALRNGGRRPSKHSGSLNRNRRKHASMSCVSPNFSTDTSPTRNRYCGPGCLSLAIVPSQGN